MGSGLKKKKAGMGNYVPSPEEQEAMIWCINNHIKMYPIPEGKGEWKIGIQIAHGEENVSPEAYGPGDIWKQMYSYYDYYYVKYREQGDTKDSAES